MSFFRRLFGKSKPSNKPLKPDSPTNKVIKKVLFYGGLVFITSTIISKKYNTKLIFTFQPNQQNSNIVDQVPAFHQGVYYPVYYMFLGPIQRIYAKYFQEEPYFRVKQYSSTKDLYQINQLPIHDKYSKKQNLPLVILLTGCEGLNINVKKIMLSMNSSGFKTYSITLDDFHNLSRLQKTISQIKTHNLNSNIYGIGLDYGANLLVNYAARNQKSFKGIVSLGNPLNLQEGQRNMQNSNLIWKKILYQDMVKGRINSCINYKNLFSQSIDEINKNKNIKLYQIDKICYTGSYENYPQLKNELSSINSVKKLKIPSLFIQSQQDPFSISIQQNQQRLENPNCIFVETQRGGHLEWFESMRKLRWISRPMSQYFKYLEGRRSPSMI